MDNLENQILAWIVLLVSFVGGFLVMMVFL